MPDIKSLLGVKTTLFISVTYTIILSISLLSSTEGMPSVSVPYLDKIVHIGAFGTLSFLWLLVEAFAINRNAKITAVLLVCFFYGIIIEALQHWLTVSRTADFLDVVANGIGCVIGYLVFLKTRSFFISQKRI